MGEVLQKEQAEREYRASEPWMRNLWTHFCGAGMVRKF